MRYQWYLQLAFNCLVFGLVLLLWMKSNRTFVLPHAAVAPASSARAAVLEKNVDKTSAVQPLSPSRAVISTIVDKLDGELGTYSPPPLPSVRITGIAEERATRLRKGYGGKGDKIHLGGFRPDDFSGRSNNTWNFMMGHLGIKSVVDVGCGIGESAKYFRDWGARVLCVEGSHDAVERNVLPAELVVEHDFTRGPYWPNETFDATWSVEFVEHVGRQFQKNYFPVFRRSALIFLTFSLNGGHHHVEMKPEWWWVVRMEAAGFVHSQELTRVIRQNAMQGKRSNAEGQHIIHTMLVFINPKLISRPEFRHLISGDGCFWGSDQVPCDERFKWHNPTVDTPPKEYQPLMTCQFRNAHLSSRRNDTWDGGPWDCIRNPLAFETRT